MNDKKVISLENMSDEQIHAFTGPQDRNLAALADSFGVSISQRDNQLFVMNCDDEQYSDLVKTIEALKEMLLTGRAVTEQNVIYASRMVKQNGSVDFNEISSVIVGRTLSGKPIVPKTAGQYAFVKAMNEKTIVFAVGPAGTGKTYLAVIQAVSALKRGDVKRIVLTRPAVEAGENLGFLPGDLKDKVDPYLTPLYDALHVMLGAERTEAYLEKGTIEIAPLAFMRGRTLDDAYVILDEAQNTTTAQMKMFLTRLGFHSKMIITGDVTQIDLDKRTPSGLLQAEQILNHIDEIAILHLSSDDVVRHPLVQKIIERYAEKN